MKECHSPKSAGQESAGKMQIPEGCRPWLQTTGDLDDFIFYQSEQKISQK